MAVGAGDGHNNNNENNNNNHNNKRVTRRSAALSLQPEQQQAHPNDFALALALQEQENAFGMQPLNENQGIRESQDGRSSAFLNDDDDEEEDEDEDEEEYEEEDFELFYSQEVDGVELEFLEGEESNGDDEDMEEDDVDPDELSYEELIALGEVVGEENRGLSTQEISSCLTKYTPPSIDSKTIIDKCVICQVEYEKLDGQGGEEKLVALPCEHSYHLDCITTWLQLRKVCPICAAEVSLPKSSSGS